MTTIQVSARVDKDLKEEAQKIFERQGLDMATVIKMLITKTAYEQRIPLDIHSDVTGFPEGWFSPQRVQTRQDISDSIDRQNTKKLDFSKQKDIDEFFDEDFPEYEDYFEQNE